ncbi:hypothetical protein B4144_0520 [Bacillus atrophaeus]|nr:hypothetical protein B4144_0520 [Bacillus atrophaeus]
MGKKLTWSALIVLGLTVSIAALQHSGSAFEVAEKIIGG